MGTDFLTVVFKEDELRRKYKNYFVPSARILVGGDGDSNDLIKTGSVQIENIQVSLSLTDAASASFSVTNIYDLEKRSVKSDVKNLLAPGNTVKIELGYESEREDVFHGFIYEICLQFGEIPSMQVTAMDVKRLMMDNYRENHTWQAAKYSEIFEEIMKDYGGLGMKLSVDSTTEELAGPLVQRGTDLRMVKQLCKLAKKKFIVCGNTANFTSKDKTDAITTLLWSQELLSFSLSKSYVDTEIEVWGNLKGSTTKEVEKRTVSLDSSIKKVRQNRTASVTVLTDIDSRDEIKTRADQEEETWKERMQSASGSCIGTPVLIPGRYVEIKGLDGDMDGEYYLKSVNHSFGSDGFTTDFTLGGKK